MDTTPLTQSDILRSIEWALSGITLALITISCWAAWVHYTVKRLDDDVRDLKIAIKNVATKDDIADIKTQLGQLVRWALGRVSSEVHVHVDDSHERHDLIG